MTGEFDPYHKWMGIPPKDQPPTHYRLLGVETFESDVDVIANAADQRMAHLRVFTTGQHVSDAQRLLNEVANARTCLLNSQRKQQYDDRLREELNSTSTGELAEAVFDEVQAVQPGQRAKPAPTTIPAFPGVQVSDETEPFTGIEVAASEDRTGTARPASASKAVAKPTGAAKTTKAPRTDRQDRPGAAASPEKRPHPKAGQIRVVGHIIAPILGLLLGAIILWYVKPSFFGGQPELVPEGPNALNGDEDRPPRRLVQKPPAVPRNPLPKPVQTNPSNTDNNTTPANTDGGNDIPLPGTFVNPDPLANPPNTDPFNVVDPAAPPAPVTPVPVAPREKTPEERRQEVQSRLAAAVEQFDVGGALDRSAELAELDGNNTMKAKFETFETCHTAAADSPEKLKAVAEAGLVLLDELIAAGNQAAAERVALATLAAAKQSKDNGLFGKAVLAYQKAKTGSGGGT